jgi:hypothetical protein
VGLSVMVHDMAGARESCHPCARMEGVDEIGWCTPMPRIASRLAPNEIAALASYLSFIQ